MLDSLGPATRRHRRQCGRARREERMGDGTYAAFRLRARPAPDRGRAARSLRVAGADFETTCSPRPKENALLRPKLSTVPSGYSMYTCTNCRPLGYDPQLSATNFVDFVIIGSLPLHAFGNVQPSAGVRFRAELRPQSTGLCRVQFIRATGRGRRANRVATSCLQGLIARRSGRSHTLLPRSNRPAGS